MTARFMKQDAYERPHEDAHERQARIAVERRMLSEARDDVAAGRIFEDDAADACLRAFTDGKPLPIPEFGPDRDR